MNALKRILIALILGKIKWIELNRFYLAMLRLENYLDLLNSI